MVNRIQLALSLLICCSASIATAQTSLKWKWEQGERLDVQLSQKIENVTTVNKRPIPMDISLEMEMTWRVIGVDSDGGATVEQKIKRLALTLKTPDKPPVEYDSKQPQHSTAARSIAETVGPLVGVPFQFDISSAGKVESIVWTDESKEAIAKVQANSSVSALLSKDGLAKMLQQTSPQLPDEPVEKGHKWSRARKFTSAFGEMTQQTTFEFDGAEDRDGRPLALIRVSGDLETETPAKSARGVLKSQELTGSLWFDTQAGRMREATIRQELNSERSYRNSVIDVKSTSTLTMKVSKAP